MRVGNGLLSSTSPLFNTGIEIRFRELDLLGIAVMDLFFLSAIPDCLNLDEGIVEPS